MGGIWIRTQNKKILIQCQSIECGFDCIVCKIPCEETVLELGTYQSKERCLEIIDKMQKWLNNKDENSLLEMVYDMPKE